MPCATVTMAGDQDNNNNCGKNGQSTTSGREASNSSAESKTASVPNGNNTDNTKRLSFSIDALVGDGSKQTEAKLPETVPPLSESWYNQLADFKRFQLYYQQLYRDNLPLKHLYSPNPHSAPLLSQHDQLVSYYTNVYLQRSYQEHYLESLKTKKPPVLMKKGDKIDQDVLATESETTNEQTSTPDDKRDKDSWYGDSNDSGGGNGPSDTSCLEPGLYPREQVLPGRFRFNESDAGPNATTTTTGASNFYSPYCDYDLLVKNRLKESGSNGTAEVDSKGTSSAAAAAAAYHISNMFRKPKRIRTAFSPGQLLKLEEIFEKNRYVVGCERKQLARDLNLSETQIKVWFQNRRTKHKREKHIGSSHSVRSLAHQYQYGGYGPSSEDLKLYQESVRVSTSTTAASSSSSSTSSSGYGLPNSNFSPPSTFHSRTLLAK